MSQNKLAYSIFREHLIKNFLYAFDI